jgi:DNA-binding SARP family transcriptional activator
LTLLGRLEPPVQDTRPPGPSGRAGLWQRLLARFYGRLGLRSSEQASRARAMHATQQLSVERAEAPASPRIGEIKPQAMPEEQTGVPGAHDTYQAAASATIASDEIDTVDRTAVWEVEAALQPLLREVDLPSVSLIAEQAERKQSAPSLAVHCFGPFRVYQDEHPVVEWPSSKGKAILKYLLAHRERPTAKEVLMELFWPGAHPDAARNNLNVAIYGLRQALRQARPSFSHILFESDCYSLNPELQIWVDAEEFARRLKAGHALEQQGNTAGAMREYHAAETLYRGEFLEEDRYEDWPQPQRQRFRDDYLGLLDRLSRWSFDQEDYAVCVTQCRKALGVDPCREEAHRRLMRCYDRQGQPYLALRQYHQCAEALERELEVTPSSASKELYERIRSHLQM